MFYSAAVLYKMSYGVKGVDIAYCGLDIALYGNVVLVEFGNKREWAHMCVFGYIFFGGKRQLEIVGIQME